MAEYQEYLFTVKGRPGDPKGNPMPKIKLTKRQQWCKRAQDYGKWKKRVASACVKSFRNQEMPRYVNLLKETKIIEPPESVKCFMFIHIYYKNTAGGDPENIFGSIADALFQEDKWLAGSFDFDVDPTGRGAVDVKLKLPIVG